MIRLAGGEVRRFASRVVHADARRTWTSRDGALLELRAEGGGRGLGEASPLPGYSTDVLEDCVAELDGCWRRVDAIDARGGIREVLAAAIHRSKVRAPAAVFALETALLDLISRERGEPAWAVLRDSRAAVPIPLSALVQGASLEELAASAEDAVGRGIRTLKVKVGGKDGGDRDVARLSAIRGRVGNDVALRLDANQSVPAADVGRWLEGLAVFAPELIEEPVAVADFGAVSKSPIPLALDESLLGDDWRSWLRSAGGACRAVVLKPMALGGIGRCFDIAAEAQSLGLAVIVTHLVDGPVALCGAACLALALPGRVLPCGLDTHDRIDDAVLAVDGRQLVPFVEPGIGVEA